MQQLNDTAFVVAGSQLQDHEQGIKPFIAIIDPYGNPKNIHYYDTLGINSVRCVTGVFANNELVFSGQYDNYYIGGSDWISISYFLKLDLNGNVKQFLLYDSLYLRQWTGTIKQTPDNYYLMGGWAGVTAQSPIQDEEWLMHLIKTDTSGNIIWQHYYDLANDLRYLQVVHPAPDNSGYYLIGTVNLDYMQHPDWADMIFVKTDTAGNVLYDYVWHDEEQEHPVDVIGTPDGGMLVVGSMRPAQFGEDGIMRGRVVKLDPDCGVDWFKRYFYGAGFSRIVAAPDGNYVLGGGMGNPDPLLYDSDAMLVKITPTGDVLWRRRYGTNQQNYLYHLIADSDGGYIFVGRTDSIEIDRAFVYMVKTNCMGLLTEPTAAFAYQTTAGSHLVELVNQSQYVYPDSIDGGHYIWDFGDGSPPYVCGRGYGACPDVVTHEYAAAQGQHTITLTAVVCSDTSAVTALVALGSGIGGQSVGVEVVEAGAVGSVGVYPNPAADKVYISYRLGEDKEALLQIYDISGKSVLRTALQGSGTQELSTANLAPGIYVLQAILNGTAIAQQKIVIVK